MIVGPVRGEGSALAFLPPQSFFSAHPRRYLPLRWAYVGFHESVGVPE